MIDPLTVNHGKRWPPVEQQCGQLVCHPGQTEPLNPRVIGPVSPVPHAAQGKKSHRFNTQESEPATKRHQATCVAACKNMFVSGTHQTARSTLVTQ